MKLAVILEASLPISNQLDKDILKGEDPKYWVK